MSEMAVQGAEARTRGKAAAGRRRGSRRRSAVGPKAVDAAQSLPTTRSHVLRMPFVPLPAMQFEARFDDSSQQHTVLTVYGSELALDDDTGFLGPSSKLFGVQRCVLLYDPSDDYDEVPSVGVEAQITNIRVLTPSQIDAEEQHGETAEQVTPEDDEPSVLLVSISTLDRVQVRETVSDPPVLVCDVSVFEDDPEVDRYIGKDGLGVKHLRSMVVKLLEEVVLLDMQSTVEAEWREHKLGQQDGNENDEGLEESSSEPRKSDEMFNEDGELRGDVEELPMTQEEKQQAATEIDKRYGQAMYATYELMSKLDDSAISFWLCSAYEPSSLADASDQVLEGSPAQIAIETKSTSDRFRLAGTVLEKAKVERGGFTDEQLNASEDGNDAEDYITEEGLEDYAEAAKAEEENQRQGQKELE